MIFTFPIFCCPKMSSHTHTTVNVDPHNQYDIKLSNMASPLEFDPKHSKERFCIDPNHSHFIFVQKTPEDDLDDEQLLALELFYEISYLGSWITSKQVAKPSNIQERVTLQKFKNLRIPFTAILMQGDFKTAKLCSRYLVKQIPILILQGTGGFADLLSYAYLELGAYLVEQNKKSTTHNLFGQTYSANSQSSNLGNLYTSNRSNIPNEYLERVLKPTLTRRIKQTFLKESKETKDYVEQFFDKILECVLHANQEGIEYVTILDVNRTETKLEYLNEYLLHNYLKCRQANQSEHAIRPQDDLNIDLRLTIEWNNCKTARQLLEHYLKTDYFTIEKSLVLDALTRKDRESFVELFLEFGFKLRSIYTFDTLTWLMRKSSKNHLFLLICCQNILGLPFKEGFPIDHEFTNELNRLIYMTCKLRNFIDLNELTNRYNSEPDCLEQKALIFFTLWSVFNFNDELTRKLWPFSAYPIHLLLIISKTLTTISEYSYNLSMRKQIDEQIEYFNNQALELLSICHSKSNTIAIRTISDQIEHWNNFFAIDIAASIEHHKLIAHQSTQKWLDYKLMNGIHLKHFGLGQFMKSIKVFLSVALVFPILFWLDYPHHVLFDLEEQQLLTQHTTTKTNDQEGSSGLKASTSEPDVKSRRSKVHKYFKGNWLKANYLDLNLSRSFNQKQIGSGAEFTLTKISLIDKWILLITTPMSKYVIHFVNWLFFLLFFSYVVIRPGCGDRTADTILFGYLFVYYVEMIRKCVIKYQNFMFTNYQWHFLEFALVTFLLVFIFLDRLNPFDDRNLYSYNGRMALLLLLFLSYLKLLSVFMPMYNTLAPLSYRIRMMSLHDISMFIGLVWPFMIAFGTTIEASLYPDRFLFDDKLTTQTFVHRTIVTLFRTPYNEILNSNDNCEQLYRSSPVYNATHCQIGDYKNANCNNNGFFSHFYLFAYIFILKFVMLTLLQALFNASMLSVEMTTIWRYQRFFLIIDFDLNYPLPPPFCVIFYFIDLARFVINRCSTKRSDSERNLLYNQNYVLKQRKNGQAKLNSGTCLTCYCTNESIAFFWRTICRELVKKSTNKQS